MTLASLEKQQSAVAFQGNARFHMSLNVTDIKASTAFYERLFQQPPTKTRPGYAKWDLAEPSLNLALNQSSTKDLEVNRLSHFGVQLKSSDLLLAQYERLKQLDMVKYEESQTACCYARQDKFWVEDPDGNRIEIFLVTEADVAENDPIHQACCVEE